MAVPTGLPPPPAHRRTLESWFVWLALGVALLLGLTGFLWWRHYQDGIWDRLEDAEEQLGTPAGFEKVQSHREGTTVCVISCDEARIVAMFRTDQRIEAACTQMLAAVQAISVSARPNDVDPDDCFYGGDLEGDGDANVSVTGYEDQGKATFTVLFNSGID